MLTNAETKSNMNTRSLILISALIGVGLSLALLVTAGAVFASQSPSNPNPQGASAGLMSSARYSGLSSAGASLDAVPAVCGQMNTVSSPNPGSSFNTLSGVSALTSNDVWAVGAYYLTFNGLELTLTEHWNGTTWTVIPSPNVDQGFGSGLAAVSAVASNDVWAVGAYLSDNNGDTQTLTEHWNGSVWSIVPGPYIFQSHGYNFTAVSALATNDVWAVGSYLNGGTDAYQQLVEHWDGSAWSVVTTSNIGPTSKLFGVSALASDDVWAVGYYETNAFIEQTLVEQWNGTAWSVVSSPNVGSSNNFLNGVSALASNNIWAVGYSNGSEQTLVEHWNGTNWSVVPSPNAGSSSSLSAVSAVASNDVWAVGGYFTVYSGPTRTLTEHWNGTAWSIVTSTNPDSNQNSLNGVTELAGGDVWAVGGYGNPGQTLAEKYGGSCGAPTSTPTPGPPTATPTIGSPTATPTPCTGFRDVPPGSTFYPFVTCLVNRGIVSGYPDCTFHVSSNVTRGQLSKIVSLAANFTDPPGNQIFQDIAPGSTFYNYAQRLANRSIIGGYACGGPGEPCVPPANRPYFRPNSNATRGQISKIVSNAANFTDAPGAQIFQDIAPGSTFYNFVQRLASRSIIGGYACGGPGEPCVAPANRPYFRPGANATRGQVSKIVANAFFPNCQSPQADK